VVQFIDSKNNITLYQYDDKDRIKKIVDPLLKEILFEYDAYDRKISTMDKWGNITRFEYDAVGNLSKTIDPNGAFEEYFYDANGNKIRMIDKTLNEWLWGYDENNRLIWEEDPLDNRTTYEYIELGWKTKTIDAKNNQTVLEYDKVGRLKKVIDPENGETNITYDPMGNTLTETDARSNTISYDYDELNRLTKIIDRNLNETVFNYNCVNLISKTNGNNETTDYVEYDGNNRLKRKNFPDSTSVIYTYDPNGNVSTMVDELGTTTYSYDELDRLTEVQDPYGKTVSYGYDTSVHKTTLTYPDNKPVVYEYDNMSRLWKVTDWLGFTTTYSYDPRSNLYSLTNTTGTNISYTYDKAGRLLTAIDKKSSGEVISSFTYTLDKVGNRTNAVMEIPLSPVFVRENTPANYDPANQITDWGLTDFDFDNSGRQINKSEPEKNSTYSYRFDDRLTQVADGTNTFQYLYNGKGDRLARVVNGVEKRYVLDLNSDMSKVLCETDDLGNITAYYVYGAGLLYKISPAGERTQYHFDPIGNTLALTNGSEVITDKYAYDPFGKLANNTGTTDNPFKYVGQYGVMDEGNGLLFMRARYYEHESKRFLSRDPVKGDIESTQIFNAYQYASNNPLILIDPSGLINWRQIGSGSLQLAGGVTGMATGIVIAGGSAGLLSWAGVPVFIVGASGAVGGLATIADAFDSEEHFHRTPIAATTGVLTAVATGDENKVETAMTITEGTESAIAVAGSLMAGNAAPVSKSTKINNYYQISRSGSLGAKKGEYLYNAQELVEGLGEFYTIYDSAMVSKNIGNLTDYSRTTPESANNKPTYYQIKSKTMLELSAYGFASPKTSFINLR
jgi:RHS repeat-associated protein